MAWQLPAALAAIAVAGAASDCWAWGATGHEWVSGIAVERLPDIVPAFLRVPEAASEAAIMGREPDRWKAAGLAHDAQHGPAHYIDLADDGKVRGVLALADLPASREDYDTLLRASGLSQYRAGYLPYAIVEGWQRLRKGFAYWRAAVAGESTAATAEERAWFAADRRVRERLLLRDIGVWSHFPGDASQPMHVSVHFSGWGDAVNPRGYTMSNFRARFQGEFVKLYLRRDVVAAAVGPYRPCSCLAEERVRALLLASLAEIEPLYTLERDGGFRPGDPRGIAFATARLAAGATAARDLIVDAWLDSADMPVGLSMVNVRDIESGRVRATRELLEAD